MEDIIQEIVVELFETLHKKNHDYGSSVFTPSRFTNVSVRDAILVRLGDKVNRLENLKDKGAEVDESFDDTIKDLAGYCICYLANKRRKLKK